MKNRNVMFVSLIMSFVLALTGCSGGGGKAASDQNGEADPAKTQQEGTPKEVGYPESLTYWVTLNSNASATLQNAGEIKAYQKLEEITGTKVQFQHPPAGSEQDSFNIMVSSGDLPDVIEHNWSAVSGGPDKLIGDGTLIRLNELIDQHAPNLKKVLEENPEYRKMITSDDGNIYVFPFLRGDDYLLTYNGLIIRQDWLDKLGLGMPETIEEWHTVLTAFKNDDPNGNGQADEIPLRLDPGQLSMNKAFLGAWGITDSFYQVDGVVKYGPIQPEFKEFLQTMSQWYAEGLIDPDYLSGDSNLWDAKITNNTLGAFTGYTGSGIGRYLQMMEGKGGSFDLAGAPNVALKKGETPPLGQKDSPFTGYGAAITSKNQNPEATVKWLDYKYGEEGSLLFNFGIEGESYEMVDGYPTYTEQITKNDSLPIAQALAQYAMAGYSGPFVQDRRYMEQYSSLPQQASAIEAWMNAKNDRLMPVISPNEEESARYASIMNDVKTYYDEMLNKFIMGVEPIDQFEAFVETIKGMGIEEAVAIQQAALDRYNSR